MIKVQDKYFEPYISADKIAEVIRDMAERISHDYAGRKPLLCPVLTGAVPFVADLMRQLSIEHEIAFVRYTSYEGTQSTHEVKEVLPFPDKCQGRDVIIVEDIVDTGFSMTAMLPRLAAKKPASIAICSLCFKPDTFKGDFKIDYIGMEVANKYIVGYGFDYNNWGRNYPDIYSMCEEVEGGK